MNQNNLWEPSRRIELSFTRALKRVSRDIINLIKRYKQPNDIINALRRYTTREAFFKFAQAAALKMVTGLFQDVGHSWRQAAAANGKSRELYQALMNELKGKKGERLNRLITENTYRIVTLPEDIGKEVVAYVERESFKGRRADDIAKEIRKLFPEHTRARAELIARTQVSYTQTNLIRTRAESLGIQWYIWRAVGGGKGDGRTRSSHRAMSGVIVNWNDPPAPEDLFPIIGKNGQPYRNTLGNYHAGQAPRCRCYPESIIDLDLVTWPSRIYRNGKIFTVTRKQFESIM